MEVFKFKKFSVYQDQCLMKLGTDSVLLGAWTSSIGPEKVLDIGTGTGVIALIIAQNNPEAIVDGIEIDADSAAQAEMNFNQSPFKSRLKVILFLVKLSEGGVLPKKIDLPDLLLSFS